MANFTIIAEILARLLANFHCQYLINIDEPISRQTHEFVIYTPCQRAMTVCYHKKKQIHVSFSSVCPVTDNEFRHNIVKVAEDPQGDSQVDPETTLTIL